MTTETAILNCFVTGLIRKLAMAETQVYPVIAPAAIDGMPTEVIQVSIGAITTEGGGEGYQDGGSIQKRGTVVLTYFLQVLMDQYRHAEEILTQANLGLLEKMEAIQAVFALTVLGGAVLEPVVYLGESATSWEDPEKGLARRDMSYGVVWAEQRPIVVSLTAEDLAN